MGDFSSGELRDYGKCPKMYRLKHVVQAPAQRDHKRAFVGGVMGKLVESFYKQRLWRLGHEAGDVLESLIPEATAAIVAKDRILWETEDEAPLYQARAAAMIPSLLATIKRERLLGEINAPEHELVIPLQGHTLHGRPDVLVERQGVVTLLDGKAGSAAYVNPDQLTFYAIGLREDPYFRRLPDRVGWWFFKTGEIAWKKMAPRKLQTFLDKVVGFVQRIVAGDFAATPGRWCRICDYRGGCLEAEVYTLSRHKDSKVALDGCEGECSL